MDYVRQKKVSMKILICNDDGIKSGGLKALAERLSVKHDVMIVAPDGNRSACSHTLTVRDSIEIKQVNGFCGCKAYAISGSPVDCVKVARLVFGDFIPDVVLSGINKGHNLGSDILYSGTVAIAYEAAFFGLPAFAFSAFSHGESDFVRIAEFCEKIFDDLFPYTKKGLIWNVNFPDVNVKIVGKKFTSLGEKVYTDSYVRENDGKYRLIGEIAADTEFSDCDVEWIKRGYITITPLKYDKCDYEALKTIGELCTTL